MTTKSWTKTSIFLAFMQILMVCTKADVVALRESSSPGLTGLEVYIDQNDRQYAAQLSSYVVRLADFRAEYQRQLAVINYNKDFIEMKIVETEQILYPLEFLNETTRNCVHQFSNLLASAATVSSQFSTCTSQAASSLNSILSSPDSTHRTLNSYYNSNWKNGVTNCANKNKNSYENHTICITQLTATTNTYFNNNQRTFNTQMDASHCSAESRIRAMAECVFPTINNSLAAIGTATRLIDDCIAGVGLCPTCPKPSNCLYKNIFADDGIYTNATIRNPFYGLNRKEECVTFFFDQFN